MSPKCNRYKDKKQLYQVNIYLTFSFNLIKFSNGATDEGNISIEERASLLAAKYSSKYDKSKATDGAGSKLTREDSTDDLMKSIALAKERRAKRLEEMMKVE